MKSSGWLDLNDGKMTSDEYFKQLVETFPSLGQAISDEDRLMLDSRMEVFADYTIAQIIAGEHTELKHCFDFQESRLDNLNSDLMNALIVSYCESMLLGECANQMKEIVGLMPDKLKSEYQRYEVHYNGMANS